MIAFAVNSSRHPRQQRRCGTSDVLRALLLVAAAVLVGLLTGIGGTLAVVGGQPRPGGAGSDHAPVATQLLTAAGEAVGSAGITTSRGQTFVLLNITTGKPGMTYECFLVGKDGQVIDRYAPTTKPEKLTDDIEKALVA